MHRKLRAGDGAMWARTSWLVPCEVEVEPRMSEPVTEVEPRGSTKPAAIFPGACALGRRHGGIRGGPGSINGVVGAAINDGANRRSRIDMQK